MTDLPSESSSEETRQPKRSRRKTSIAIDRLHDASVNAVEGNQKPKEAAVGMDQKNFKRGFATATVQKIRANGGRVIKDSANRKPQPLPDLRAATQRREQPLQPPPAMGRAAIGPRIGDRRRRATDGPLHGPPIAARAAMPSDPASGLGLRHSRHPRLRRDRHARRRAHRRPHRRTGPTRQVGMERPVLSPTRIP